MVFNDLDRSKGFGTGTAWPDLAVAMVMAGLAISSGWTVMRQARSELAWDAAT